MSEYASLAGLALKTKPSLYCYQSIPGHGINCAFTIMYVPTYSVSYSWRSNHHLFNSSTNRSQRRMTT